MIGVHIDVLLGFHFKSRI